MKKNNITKKTLAVFLSLVMMLMSVPFSIIGTAAGAYDPAPYFDTAAQTEGADAWLDDEGNVQVTFPAATAQPTYKGEALSIAFYILELVNMGANNEAHTNVVLDTIKVTGLSGTFPAADIGTIDLVKNRYSVTVTAVDTENWFSLPIYTTVTKVPAVEVDGSRFENFSTSATAVREIMTFDQSGTDTGVATGNALNYMGVAAEAGTEDLSDNVGDTSALRFIMYNQPSGEQTFDTSLSRQTWDFSNATEVWFWMDLSNVELSGVSFRLRANEKVWYDWGSDQSMTVTQKDFMGDIIYSTKGYKGTDGFVYVQRDDGGWDKENLTNGTIDLANFKGYVRVPIKFICSENDSYAQLKNTGFNNGSTDFATGWTSATLTNGDNHANGIPITKTLVDAAGTNIKDARLMQHRIVATKTGIGGMGNSNYWHFTNGAWVRNQTESITRGEDAMIAAGLSEAEAVNDADEGYKAIDDLYSAGFAFTGCSADSLENSFFIDNIFFYDENGGPWDENAVSGMASSTGNSMSTYYNEELAIAKIIFDEIDKYIPDPDWADYRELEYVLDLVAEYVSVYSSLGKDTKFLNLTRSPDTTGLAGMATTLGREDTWERAWKAWEACTTEGTIASDGTFLSNASKNDLVPLIVNTMEKLPKPDGITSVSDALRAEIVKLWQAYSLLNLGQLEMLGDEEEKTLLKYFALIENIDETDGDKFVVGQRLADNPFIVFNDFENYELGEKAWKLEDNKDAYTTGVTGGTSNLANDWRHIKSLVTYTTNGNTNITDKDYYGYVTTDSDKSQESMDGKVHYNASEATITNDGYLHSKGVNLYSDSSFTTSENDGVFHTITVTKDGNPIGSDYSNNMSAANLGGLAQSYSAATTTSVPLALIFYVDFTQIQNFYFTVNVFTIDENGNHVKCRVNTGLNNADRKYWILDNETGEWEIIYTTNQWVFNSAGNQEESTNQGIDYNKIEGYRGYLMIPLYHIKQYNSVVDEDKLDEEATILNNIFAIQFCIGGANATDMDEKSIVIDNVGFTYSKDSYSAASSRNDPSYAEVFGAKSLPASNFEAAVAAIDPYDETTISAATQDAQKIYATLPDYQKQVVAESYKKLQLYITYVNNPANIPQPTTSAADLQTWITNNLTADATGASVTGDKDLVYPGFTSGEVNYSTYGLTTELATQLSDFYTNSYVYYTKAEKQAVNDAGFLNAYNAAMRCLGSLESIKSEAGSYGSASAGVAGSGFLGELSTNLYERKFDADGNFVGNFVSIAGRDTVETFKEDKYDVLQYYTKTTIDDGSYNANVQNISRGFTYFLSNTRSFTIDGEEINGGIINLRDKLQIVYDIASEHIQNRVRFSADELQYVKDILEEYNALLPAYYNVEELYELEQDIIGLFSVADVAVMDAATDGANVTTVELNNNDEASMKQTVYVDLPYIAALLDTTVTLQAVSTLELELKEGVGTAGFDSFTAGSITADVPLTLGTYDNLYPDETFSRIPIEIAVDPTLAAQVPFGALYEGKITFNVYETADIDAGLTGDDLVPIATFEIPVAFNSTNGPEPIEYTVEIPAEITVDWDDTSTITDVTYKIVNANLEDGTLIVSMADSNEDGDNVNNLKSTAVNSTGNAEYLKYTANFPTGEYTGKITTETTPDPIPSITIKDTFWNSAPVGEYKTTLTYTVVYDDGDSTT